MENIIIKLRVELLVQIFAEIRKLDKGARLLSERGYEIFNPCNFELD